MRRSRETTVDHDKKTDIAVEFVHCETVSGKTELLDEDPGFQMYREINDSVPTPEELVGPLEPGYWMWKALPLRSRNFQLEHNTMSVTPVSDKMCKKVITQTASQVYEYLLSLPSREYKYTVSGLDPDAIYHFGISFDTNGYKFEYLRKEEKGWPIGFYKQSTLVKSTTVEVRHKPKTGAQWMEGGLDFSSIRFSGCRSGMRHAVNFYNVILLEQHRVYTPVITIYDGDKKPIRDFKIGAQMIFSAAFPHYYTTSLEQAAPWNRHDELTDDFHSF